jgi:chromosome partitioning protein
MAEIVAIANQKGGVGKTTTTITLAHALGRMNKKVLVVDADPQHSATLILGKVSPFDHPLSIIELFEDEDVNFSNCATESQYKNVDLIPSHIDLAYFKNQLTSTPAGMVGLREKLDQEALDNYNYILIDCPPDLGGPLINNALTISNYYIITMKAEDYYALKGMQQLQKSISTIRKTINKELHLLGVLITMADLRTKVARTMISGITKYFGKHNVFNTIISNNTAINQATVNKKTIIKYDIRQQGAKDYINLAEEFVKWTNGDRR